MGKEVFAPEFAEDLQLHQLNLSRDLMQHAQYINAIHAVWSIETDKGGLPLSCLWEETEWMRQQLRQTDRQMRPFIVADLYGALKQHAEGAKSQCVERSVMCIMMLFALRLVTASKKKDDNPNGKVIRAIVRMLAEKMNANEERMDEMKRLLQTIDKDGDENERDGSAIVEMGVDILADDADWQQSLVAIVETYIQKADKLIDRQMSDAFDAVWMDLLKDSRFMAEMRESSLGQNYNLVLLFNVFGLMYPAYYKSTCRGALTIAKAVGYNQELKNEHHCYSKDYFSQYQIEKLKQGFKTDEFLEHVKGIIERHKKK